MHGEQAFILLLLSVVPVLLIARLVVEVAVWVQRSVKALPNSDRRSPVAPPRKIESYKKHSSKEPELRRKP